MHPTDTPQAAATGSATQGSAVVQPARPGPATERVARGAAALAALNELDGLDLAAHPDVYERIHHELRGALSEIDNA